MGSLARLVPLGRLHKERVVAAILSVLGSVVGGVNVPSTVCVTQKTSFPMFLVWSLSACEPAGGFKPVPLR